MPVNFVCCCACFIHYLRYTDHDRGRQSMHQHRYHLLASFRLDFYFQLGMNASFPSNYCLSELASQYPAPTAIADRIDLSRYYSRSYFALQAGLQMLNIPILGKLDQLANCMPCADSLHTNFPCYEKPLFS